MADLKTLKTLVIGGVSYNIGWSENDFNAAYKAQLDGLTDSLAGTKNEAIAAGALTISEAAGSGDILKTYTFTQNGAEVGKINLAKDLVVSGGEIVEKDGVKYLSLSIANQDTPVEIPVTDLVDVYTGSTYIAISEGNEISVKFADLDAALAAETATVGAKLKANAEAAAAAQSAADKTQGEVDALELVVGAKADEANADGSVFAQINKVKADLNSLSGGAGSVSDQIDTKLGAYNTETVQPINTKVDNHIADTTVHITAEERTAWNAAKTASDANTTKLAGISEGANKVGHSYDESSGTLTITIE